MSHQSTFPLSLLPTDSFSTYQQARQVLSSSLLTFCFLAYTIKACWNRISHLSYLLDCVVIFVKIPVTSSIVSTCKSNSGSQSSPYCSCPQHLTPSSLCLLHSPFDISTTRLFPWMGRGAHHFLQITLTSPGMHSCLLANWNAMKKILHEWGLSFFPNSSKNSLCLNKFWISLVSHHHSKIALESFNLFLSLILFH